MNRDHRHRRPVNVVFRKYANIGAADAMEDSYYLGRTFVDNGALRILRDLTRPECIIIGRTGSGKTALLERLKETESDVIEIVPEDLALAYISNNEVLAFFRNVGVDLGLFYRLLWRHVFVVELLKRRYNIVNETTRDNFLVQMLDFFQGRRSKRDALQYLQDWGGSFWQETEYRIKEITEKLEQQLGRAAEAALSVSIPPADITTGLNSQSAMKLTEETKAEVRKRGQDVVNQVQMYKLSEIIKMLDTDILDDAQRAFYITIDRLDEDWVNDALRYHLIRALLETVRTINSDVEMAKIIVAMRVDLLDRVFRYTRSAGYQEEKYQSMYLPLYWQTPEIVEILDRRVNQLFKDQYTNADVHLSDVLPAEIDGVSSEEYVLARTMLTPRGAITFFNDCIALSTDEPRITRRTLKQAEANYSIRRLRALADEWSADYANLIELAQFLRGYPERFTKADVLNGLDERLLEFIFKDPPVDSILAIAKECFNLGAYEEFADHMLDILYRVGVIGIKRVGDHLGDIQWSYLKPGRSPQKLRMDNNDFVYVHQAFHSHLRIRQL